MARQLVEMGNACCGPVGRPFIPNRMGGIFSSIGLSVSNNFFPTVLGKVQKIGVGTIFSLGGAASIGLGAFLGRRLGLGFMLAGIGATGYGLWTLYKALSMDEEDKKDIEREEAERNVDRTTVLQERQSTVSGAEYLIDKYFPWFHRPKTITYADARLAQALVDEYVWRRDQGGYVQHITLEQWGWLVTMLGLPRV